jgi:DNA primase
VHRAVQAAGGVCGGREGPAWLQAVVAECPTDVRGLVSELAVEPLELPQKNIEEVRYVASIVSGVRLALVDEQIAEIKSRLQRTNPVEEADAYHELFGDLVPLEQYRIALREKAMGAVG